MSSLRENTQQEILKPLALLNADGTLKQPGWARQPFWDYQRAAIAAPRWRVKEWDYYAVLSADQQYAIAITVADLGYIGLFALCYIDLASGQYSQVESLSLLPMGKTLPSAVDLPGHIEHRSAKLQLQIDMSPGQRRIRFNAPHLKTGDGRCGLSGDLLLHSPANHESMNIATAWAENPKAFYYNSKINCLAASGNFTLAGQEHHLNPARDSGVLDWGRGVWTYKNRWYWSSASGHIDGQAFGFNLGYGFSDRSPASENVLILDGKIHKLDQVSFSFDPDDYLKPWRFTSNDQRLTLHFQPLLDRHSKLDVKLMKSIQHQVFGHFSGEVVLDCGKTLIIDQLLGFAEDVLNWW